MNPSKAEQLKNLKNGMGIERLLEEVYKIIGNPILVHDMEYKVIKFNQNVVTDDPIWLEYAAKGTVGYEWLDFFKNECFLEAAANTKKITILTSDKLKYNRYFGKIFNKNSIQIGCACMVACDKPFEDEDVKLFEEICSIISKELGLNQFYNDYGQAYLEKLLFELIEGVADKELYTAHVESIYMHLKSNLYLAVADAEASGLDTRSIRDKFMDTQPEFIYALYLNYILIIISTDSSEIHIEKDFGRLNRLFDEYNIRAGISSSFDNLFELNKYYDEALNALNNGLGATERRIFLSE